MMTLSVYAYPLFLCSRMRLLLSSGSIETRRTKWQSCQYRSSSPRYAIADCTLCDPFCDMFTPAYAYSLYLHCVVHAGNKAITCGGWYGGWHAAMRIWAATCSM